MSAKLAGKDVDAAFDHLTAIQHAGGDGYAVRMALAEIAEGKKDKAAYRAALEAAHRFDPSQNEPLKGLFDMAHEPRREARSRRARAAPKARADRRAQSPGVAPPRPEARRGQALGGSPRRRRIRGLSMSRTARPTSPTRAPSPPPATTPKRSSSSRARSPAPARPRTPPLRTPSSPRSSSPRRTSPKRASTSTKRSASTRTTRTQRPFACRSLLFSEERCSPRAPQSNPADESAAAEAREREDSERRFYALQLVLAEIDDVVRVDARGERLAQCERCVEALA